jgi:hypothetical protein
LLAHPVLHLGTEGQGFGFCQQVRFVSHGPGPITTDRGVLVVGATHSFHQGPT